MMTSGVNVEASDDSMITNDFTNNTLDDYNIPAFANWKCSWFVMGYEYHTCIRADYIIRQNNYIIEQNKQIINNLDIIKCYQEHIETRYYWYESNIGFGNHVDKNANDYLELKHLCPN